MPPSPRSPLRRDDVDAVIASCCWPERAATQPDAVGIEVEAFGVRRDSDGAPAGRVPLARVAGLLERAGAAATPERATPHGAVSFEPGGQVEYATPPCPTPAAALEDLEVGGAWLAQLLHGDGAVLAETGLDVWHPLGGVRQQLRLPRYQAMEDYFDARGGPEGPGAVMMRHTCALQVNLDLGPPAVAIQRWLVAALAAPLVTGTFACSPVPGGANGRALAWQALDPTRTGHPAALTRCDGPLDPVAALAQAALDADVLLHRTVDGAMVAGRPGVTFADWIRDGHPVHGPPTADDLAYHLTTLWHEVRVRGFLEIRGVDALPARWRAVPVVLLAGLLYDDRARDDVLGVLERHRPDLSALSRRAARTGLADPALCAMAVETWSHALSGARRLSAGAVRSADLATAESFLDHFTLRGRCPSDELREHLSTSPAAALAWATDPVDTRSPV